MTTAGAAERHDYRPDIDGLRALAILPVLLYHLGFSAFGGGFVGVDVFFVISGYLITSNIYKDLEAGRFTFRNFYTRRARRIFPALFATLLGTFLVGAFLMLPSDFARLAESTVAAILSVSNFLFWLQAGYFDTEAIQKPLLHTWSLAVEEQFYFVWPLALFLMFKAGGVRLFPWLVGLVFVASIAFAEYQLQDDPSGAFYLIPARAAELAAGAAIVWLQKFRMRFVWLNEALVDIGLVAIVVAVFTFTDDMRFPGISALLPALGAAAIIYAGPTPYIGRLLNNPPAIWIGLISYSLYLVHWPIIALYHYVSLEEPGLAEQLIMLVASCVLAVLSYFLVEQPFRAKGSRFSAWTPRAALVGCGGLALAFAGTAALAYQQDGWEWRYPQDIQVFARSFESGAQERTDAISCIRSGRCQNADDAEFEVLVVGDSFANDYLVGLGANYPNVYFSALTGGGCVPFLDYVDDSPPGRARAGRCDPLRDEFFAEDLASYDAVILAIWWQDDKLAYLERTLAHLEPLPDNFIIFGPRITLNAYPNELFRASTGLDNFETLLHQAANLEKYEAEWDSINAIAANFDVTLVDIGAYQGLEQVPAITSEGTSFFVDRAHFSADGVTDVIARMKSDMPDLFK